MALYVKQDFTPPFMSRRWIAMKFRPNMILYSRHHVISVLESGLLFREDSIEVEEGSPVDEGTRWLTTGERVAALAVVAACVAACPPKSLQRSTLLHLGTYAALPIVVRALHRHACRGSLPALIDVMRNYLVLSRRAAACVKEFAAMRAELVSVTSAVKSTHTMLCRQQQEMAVMMSRASSALLGNAPWLRSDLAWEAIQSNHDENENFMKIHHAFLVVQSTLLKHIAMAHFLPSVQARKLYKNHNERIYWIHSILIPHLTKDFNDNYEALERMYRLLKNFGSSDMNCEKRPGKMMTDSWIYSEVHTGIARSSLELKLALDKCNSLDMFLDSCALNKQEIDVEILNKDLEEVIDCIVRSLDSMQNSQLRLKKMRRKITDTCKKETEGELVIEREDDKLAEIKEAPPAKDEVYYFVKTDDDDKEVQPMADVTTAPGKKERENTKIVLKELKRKLVKREDLMRERERQALINTMPELKDKLPEFPRQIKFENHNGKGLIAKIAKKVIKKSCKRPNKLIAKNIKKERQKYKMLTVKLSKEKELSNVLYDSSSCISSKSKASCVKNSDTINNWWKSFGSPGSSNLTSISERLSGMNTSPLNATVPPSHSPVLELNLPVSANLEQGDFQGHPFEDGSSNFFKSVLENMASASNQDSGLLASTQNGSRLSSAENGASFVNPHNGRQGNIYPDFNRNNVNKLAMVSENSETDNYKFSKKDMELSPSSSECDFEFDDDSLSDSNHTIRRRIRTKKALHKRRYTASSDVQDESLRPMEYSLSAGLAMAGVLQGRGAKPLLTEQVFTAEGDVDSDSGHDD